MTATYKICRCCGRRTYQLRKRNCDYCGPAIWDKRKETDEEKAERKSKSDFVNRVLKEGF